MALDIIQTKLFKEPKEIIEKFIPKYRCDLTFKSKAFNFINLPKILRSKEVCDNVPSNFNISDIPMVVYNLNPSIRSTLFNQKQFVLHLNTDEFLKNPNSIKCCSNKYENSFINNHYGYIITGNLNIVNNERLRQLLSKGSKYREPKQICFEEAREEIQTGIDQFIEQISNDKDIHKNHFSEWKSPLVSPVTGKFFTLKNKIACRAVKPICSEHEVKNIMFSLKENFVIVPIDKAADNVAFICKQFYALTIIKELNLDCHL